MHTFIKKVLQTDWLILAPVMILSLFGLFTMKSFIGQSEFFSRQIIWILIASTTFLVASNIDWRFLRRTSVAVVLYSIVLLLLAVLFFIGSVFKGAQSWFDIGLFAFQPVDIAKIVLIIVLSKYFSRRHIEIANVRHILVSGLYAFLIFILIVMQPDFGSSIIILSIWLGMIMVSGVSKKHLLVVAGIGILSIFTLWFFVFADYQKTRIISFLNPLEDLQGAGYNAYQSTIAVGSGQIFGKGFGLGSQSKLEFLPEHETDFIFAAFAEEWGIVGAGMIFSLFSILFYRIMNIARSGISNFETLFAFGVFFVLLSHFVIHVGMNLALLPVTGITMPFMSYGGSHLVAEYLSLGMIVGMNNYSSQGKRESNQNEMLGAI